MNNVTEEGGEDRSISSRAESSYRPVRQHNVMDTAVEQPSLGQRNSRDYKSLTLQMGILLIAIRMKMKFHYLVQEGHELKADHAAHLLLRLLVTLAL